MNYRKLNNWTGSSLFNDIITTKDYGKNHEAYRVKFYYPWDDKFVAVDNTSFDCWQEVFKSERLAKLWLDRG
jgi:hypothetical protein